MRTALSARLAGVVRTPTLFVDCWLAQSVLPGRQLSARSLKELVMQMFEGKKGLILGVFNNRSIAWQIAEVVMQQGGVCGLSYMPDKPDDERQKNRGRLMKLIEGMPAAKFIHPMDVTSDEQIAALMKKAKEEFGKLDFLLHSIAF